MGPKKGLSDFIKKNQKKEKKTTGAAEATSAPTTGEQIKAADAEVAKTQQIDAKNTPGAKKADSSDEEEDELELANKQMSYGNIKENKDIASSNNKNKDEKMGYGLDEGQEETKVANVDAKTKSSANQPKKGFGEGITFAKPSFGRRKPAAGGKFGNDDFKEGLDDIDDDGSVKKKEPKSRADGGQREFVNLGSQPRGPRDAEEKRAPAEKPRFRGKLNLTGTGGTNDEANAGVKKDYDFGVVYKSAHPEGERREGGEHRKERKPKQDRGVELGAKTQAAIEDDDFTVVRNKDRKRKVAKQDSDSSDEATGLSRAPRVQDDSQQNMFGFGPGDSVRGARVERGGNRGGRGGFFKNSNKAKTDA